MKLGAVVCSCGARFVGDPLDDVPFKVKRFGPVMTAVGVPLLVLTASLVFTWWLALGGVVAIVLAARAMKLARRDPEGYGGYRVAAGTLVVTLISGGALAAFEIGRIPEYFKKREMRKVAATEAAMLHFKPALEDYLNKYGSLPKDEEAFKKATGQDMPADFWDNQIKYRSNPDQVAGVDMPVIEFTTFELRSPGPDGKFGTADDIVMRDGIFLTPEEVAKQTRVKPPSNH